MVLEAKILERKVAIHETLAVTDELQGLIMSNPSRDELSNYWRSQELPSLFDDGIDRVRAQQTTIEEVSRVLNG